MKIVKAVEKVSEVTSEDGEQGLMIDHPSSNVDDKVLSEHLHQLSHTIIKN